MSGMAPPPLPTLATPYVNRVAWLRPQPHTSTLLAALGLPNAFISRQIQFVESASAVVDPDAMLNATASGTCWFAIRRIAAAVRSSASSQPMRCQPGSGSPLGRERFSGWVSRSLW